MGFIGGASGLAFGGGSVNFGNDFVKALSGFMSNFLGGLSKLGSGLACAGNRFAAISHGNGGRVIFTEVLSFAATFRRFIHNFIITLMFKNWQGFRAKYAKTC